MIKDRKRLQVKLGADSRWSDTIPKLRAVLFILTNADMPSLLGAWVASTSSEYGATKCLKPFARSCVMIDSGKVRFTNMRHL
jgi:hypothetical protein